MLKSKELTQPDSCLNKAADDEIVFVLLARDEAAPHVIRQWCMERVRLQKNEWDDPQISEALDCARDMELYRKNRYAISE